MRLREVWGTTTFRLTCLYGLVFALGVVALLGMVYLESAGYLTRRVDGILHTEAAALATIPPQALPRRIGDALALDGNQTNIFALFDARGGRVAGDLAVLPGALRLGAGPVEIPPSPQFGANARLIALHLASGETLVVGRDVNQLQEMRSIIASALLWSGVAILLAGLGSGVALSIAPLRRLRLLQAAGQAIGAGDLKQRMPTSRRDDELDLLAGTVNYMMDQVERLMAEVKGVSQTIAHDLRTPLTRARSQLHRLQQSARADPDALAKVIGEIDEVLDRFRALLRISELEAFERRGGFSAIDLDEIVERAVELYQPLAEAGGVRLDMESLPGCVVEADAKLLFEAISNLLDNAIKFTGAGGGVKVRVRQQAGGPQIVVQDNGPGIAADERVAVLQRFYRSERNRLVPGSGLGLSIVSAIIRLHGYELVLEDATPGLRAIIDCRSHAIKY